mmetsp:Transcript_26556/g.47063  ORF Transcript_26556/g.47063 Transcript_26556/m.47063 type:complete len:265 (+) Transcript_26556:3148-3942(+)
MLHLDVLVSDAEALQTLHLVVVGDPEHVVGTLLLQLFQSGRDLLGKQAVDLFDLALLLLQGAEGSSLLVLVHTSSGSLLDHAQGLLRLHVDHLSDATLHDEEVGVVHVEGHGMEKVLDLILLNVVRVEEVAVAPADDDLPCDRDLVVHLIPDRTAGLVLVVEDYGHAGLCHSSLALLVHELRQVADANLSEIGDAENKANGVQDVGLATAIQASDCIELLVKRPNIGSCGVGFEAISDELLDVHLGGALRGRALGTLGGGVGKA